MPVRHLVIFVVAFPLATGAASDLCVRFSELTVGATYVVSNTFASAGVQCEVERFQWSAGQWTSNGNARVQSVGPGNIGAEVPYLWLNNVNVRLDVGTATDVRLNYGAFGGNQNLRINGVLTNFGSMLRLHGMVLGNVRLALNPSTNGRGELRLTGIITDFAMGGQEFAIDDICITPYDGPKFRQVIAGPADQITLIFSYPGTDAASRVLKYSSSLQPDSIWLADPNAAIVSTAPNWFRAITTRPPGLNQAFFRIE